MNSIEKAFEILDLFFEKDSELSISEVSRLTNINPSTTHRIAAILVKRGYVDHPHKKGMYSLNTAKLLHFAGIIRKRLKVRTVALPYIRKLSQKVNEAVELSLCRGPLAYNIEVINIDRLLNITADSHTFNLYSTGVGKVFLAYMSDDEFQHYVNGIVLQPRTPNTITDADELKRKLREIRENGVAFDDEEHQLGVRNIAAPVRDWENSVIAAIGIIGLTTRISRQRMIELAPEVKSTADKISHEMGYIEEETRY
jgi:IclR family KDG regulon transcriptional repressor